MADFRLGIVNLKNAKHLKYISEQLMSIAWHPKKWWNFCMSGDEKNEIEPIFADQSFSFMQYESIEIF